jgi:hypothetical protein
MIFSAIKPNQMLWSKAGEIGAYQLTTVHILFKPTLSHDFIAAVITLKQDPNSPELQLIF